MEKKQKNKNFKDKLTFQYRFVVLNEETFEERFSFKLNRLSAFVYGGLFSIVLIALTAAIIAFTPLKEYLQGYSSTELKKEASSLVYKVDSLQQELSVNNLYIQNLQQVLTGEIEEVDFDKDSIMEQLRMEEVDLSPSAVDSSFRKEVESEDKFSIFEQAARKTDVVFLAPIKGQITQVYDNKDKHFAIDIAVDKEIPVKSIADGTIIFTGFTADTGYVIIIEHDNGVISVYKHNASIFKEQGDLVKAGEAIAIAGSTGELSTGTHLHFELWDGGYPVNPTNYIDFE